MTAINRFFYGILGKQTDGLLDGKRWPTSMNIHNIRSVTSALPAFGEGKRLPLRFEGRIGPRIPQATYLSI